ncbi:FAD-dependent oxidoreductase [Devosia sp.]|uniref:FAD-dependent oxidoreductase n=1 Tax=Devosia sp. TaxID=1871048 RepID=UPI003A922F5C
MSAADGRRLNTPGIDATDETISFSFDGQPVTALAGESLAATLTAAGLMDLREAHAGDRRGVFCGMGACQECLVEIDGKGSQRACMSKVVAGMDARRAIVANSQLKPLAATPQTELNTESCDVAIVGAGPAALAAAAVLAGAGLTTVMLDERDQAGGQYFKPLAPSHHFDAGPTDSQFAEGDRRRHAALAAGAEHRPGSLVWQASADADGQPELAINGPQGAYLLRPKAVLLATGAYEAPHHVPGWTLPGVMTAGAAQTLARAYRVSPGQRIVVAGNGPLNWQVALELARGGAKVVALIESSRLTRPASAGAFARMALHAPGLALDGMRMRAALAVAGIAVHEATVVTGLSGTGHVEQVTARRADGRELTFKADAVSLGYGFIPTAELARMLGCDVRVDARTGFPVAAVDDAGRSSVGTVWVAGDGAGIRGSQAALARGELAALDIVSRLKSAPVETRSARTRLARAGKFQDALWTLFAPAVETPEPTPETVICRCEGVTAGTITAAGAAGVADIGSLKRQTRLGMGRCQGRYCTGKALKLLRGDLSDAVEADLMAPQAPVRPVPAAALALEKGEWGGHREVPTHVTPRGAATIDALPPQCDLLVIGGGITGASTAMYAARDGMEVVVVDRSAPNSEASGGNAGSLHVQLLSWDFGKKAMAGGSPAQRTLPLQRDSVALWKTLERELSADFEIVTTGGLMVAEDEAQATFLRDKAAAEQAVGIDTQVIGRDELSEIAPAVSERMVVAAYCAAEGKINPLKATPVIVAEAQRLGARFCGGHGVTAIAPEGTGYRISTAAGGSIVAKRVVIAAGGWSRHLGTLLDCNLPISGAPLQMLVTEPTRPLLKQLIAHADRHLTMKQATSGNLIIGGAWTADTHARTGYSRVLRDSIEGNLWVAERTVPAVAGLHLIRSWAAMNINIDGAPLLGALPGHPGVFVAATANGYTLGPMMGMLTAALAAGRDPGRAIDYFTLQRFD